MITKTGNFNVIYFVRFELTLSFATPSKCTYNHITVLSPYCNMFRHRNSIIRDVLQWFYTLYVLPDEGSSVPKHAAVKSMYCHIYSMCIQLL